MRRKKALVTGITGQDGSYLAEFLLALGYEVHGLVRRASTFNTSRIDHLQSSDFSGNLTLHHSDLLDSSSISHLVAQLRPDEIYNLAAQSHVRVSFEIPMTTSQVTGLGTLGVVEAIRQFCPESRFYQASSSEMFGASPPPQNEDTTFHPRSPYGVSKLYSFWITKNYREAYGVHASNGILFNHESPRRSPTFLTRKVTRAAARISAGLDKELVLGNLEARRDWGYAPEYVVGMWMMLQQDSPGDFVLGTGTSTSVKEWATMAFESVGLELRDYLSLDKKFERPSEVDDLIGDSSKANVELGWSHATNPDQLMDLMLRHDRELLKDPDAIDSVTSPLWKDALS